MKKFICMVAAAACAVSGPEASAKIGERKIDIEKRMNSRANGAYQYPDEEALREALELPYSQIFWIQPLGSSNSFYFKRPSSELSTRADALNQREIYGWEVHVAYLKDISVMEFYKRCGDPMTMEEAKGLMVRMAKTRENASWKKAEFKAFKPEEKADDPALGDVLKFLPRNEERYIALEIPKEVSDQSNFDSSLAAMILQDEMRATFENYSKILEEAKKYSDTKTASGGASKAKGSTKNISAMEDVISRKSVIPFSGVSSGFSLGGVPPKNRTRSVRAFGKIPVQADTAVGYEYELSDGSMRALIYNCGILFIDTRYDKLLRETMEKLYDNQREKRERAVEESLHKF